MGRSLPTPDLTSYEGRQPTADRTRGRNKISDEILERTPVRTGSRGGVPERLQYCMGISAHGCGLGAAQQYAGVGFRGQNRGPFLAACHADTEVLSDLVIDLGSGRWSARCGRHSQRFCGWQSVATLRR